jgi:outer membrane receptor protein involved in Fe transport
MYQIDVAPKLKINVGGRYDDFRRDRFRIFTADPNTVTGVQQRNQTAYTYRAGLVFAPVGEHQFYASSSSSFTPVFDVPSDGSELKPRRGRGYEVGHRWQGFDRRLQTSVAVYHLRQNNLTFAQNLLSVIQAGKQTAKGVDIDVNADLGYRTRLLVNYGYTNPKFDEFFSADDDEDFSGNLPRFAQKHVFNIMWDRCSPIIPTR